MNAVGMSLAATLLCSLNVATASDQGVLWIAGSGGSWHDPANWSTGSVPDADDLAIIPAVWDRGFVITGDGRRAECDVLQVDQAGITLNLGSQLVANRVLCAGHLTIAGTAVRDRLIAVGAWTFGSLRLEAGAALGPVISTVRVSGPLSVVGGSTINVDHCDARGGVTAADSTFAGILHSVHGAAVFEACEFPADHVEILGPTLHLAGGSMQPAVSLLLQDCEATLHGPATGGLWSDVVRSAVLIGAGGLLGGADSIVLDSVLDVEDGGGISVVGVFELGSTSELRGGGEVDAIYLEAGGVINPGGVGRVAAFNTARGEIWMHPTSRVRLDIGGEEPAQFDRVVSSLGFRLDGSLEIGLVNGFEPGPGSEFLVLEGPVQSGELALVQAPELAPGLEWRLNVSSAGASLVVARDCLADFNADGLVTTADVVAFLDNWTQSAPGTDVNDDDAVDTRDVTQFLNAWVLGC